MQSLHKEQKDLVRLICFSASVPKQAELPDDFFWDMVTQLSVSSHFKANVSFFVVMVAEDRHFRADQELKHVALF